MKEVISTFLKVTILVIMLVGLFLGVAYAALSNKNTQHENVLQNYQIKNN